MSRDRKAILSLLLCLTGSDPVIDDGRAMPARNRVKIFVENSYYHVYNRGVDKREIFLDDQDYRVFLSFLKAYLSAPQASFFTHPIAQVTGSDPVRLRPLRCFFGEIILLAYCLMPNHYHLLLWQSKRDGMTRFLRALCTSYVMYFNKKYERVGTLFQGIYKAAMIDSENYLLHLSRYIHLNPLELTGSDPVKAVEYPYSSYPYYLNKRKAEWVNPFPILDFFRSARNITSHDMLSYQSFVEDYASDPREKVGALALD